MNEQKTSRYLEDRAEGTYYTGPLHEAQVVVEKDHYINVVHSLGHCRVELTDDPEHQQVSDWGDGPDLDTAVRYAFGAYFGPLDEEYPGDEYVMALLNQPEPVEPKPNPLDAPHEWNPDTCDDGCQHVSMLFDRHEDGGPYAYLEVNGRRVMRFGDPWSIQGLTEMMNQGAVQLAVKMIAHQDGIPEELAWISAQLMMATGKDVIPVNVGDTKAVEDRLLSAIDGILATIPEPDTEGSAHCEDCGHWLDSKNMCPSCLPNSQRNPDERVED